MVRMTQGGAGGGGGGLTMGSTTRCEDCGNKSKKGCMYMRCRTCCNNKGFQCQTHVKSTWVPLFKRSLLHEQQQQQLQSHDHHHHHYHQQQQRLSIDQGHFIINPNKRLRQHNPSSSSTGLDRDHHKESSSFPAEVTAMAKFRCVRVSCVEDMVDMDQHAYQASVIIGGHVFKGILFDQGPAVHQSCYTSPPASAADQPQLPPNSSSSSYPLINPFNAFTPAGTQFF